MDRHESVAGVLLEDAALALDEFARACAVEPDWVVRHVQAGLLGGMPAVQVTEWRFHSADLRRARHMRAIEQAFDAGDELAALVVDLSDEVRRLKARLRSLGVSVT